MSLTDELQRLADLKASGALTEDEFQKAKSKLLEAGTTSYVPKSDDEPDQSLGRAANRYVTYQVAMAVIVILIFLFVVAPKMCSGPRPPFFP